MTSLDALISTFDKLDEAIRLSPEPRARVLIALALHLRPEREVCERVREYQ